MKVDVMLVGGKTRTYDAVTAVAAPLAQGGVYVIHFRNGILYMTAEHVEGVFQHYETEGK